MKRVFSKFMSGVTGAVLLLQLRLLQKFLRRYRHWIPQNRQILVSALQTEHLLLCQLIPALERSLMNDGERIEAGNRCGEIFLKYLSPQDVVIALGREAISLLDLLRSGIGRGYALLAFQEYDAIDLLARRQNNLEFVRADVESFDFAQFKQKAHYTAVALTFLLEYLPDPIAFLRAIEADRLCICSASQEHRFIRTGHRLKMQKIFQKIGYTRRKLAAQLTAAGYLIHYIGHNADGDLECYAAKPNVAIAARPRVCYASIVPEPSEIANGGRVKLLYLSRMYPECFDDFDLLYLVSSALPMNIETWIAAAKARGAKIVLNQDGVAYPAWAGEKHEEINRPLRMALNAADWVFYQSRFSRISADRFLQRRDDRYSILHNPVDTMLFCPPEQPRQTEQLTLLLAGNQYEYYRFETALRTLSLLKQSIPTVRLLITGQLNWISDLNTTGMIARKLIQELQLEQHIEFIGSYTQREAPVIYRTAHILLHPKYNDPCPTVVIEAMACGLPVVYSNSGGTPELVGQDAGIGIDAECNWERIIMPSAHELALAVNRIWNDYDRYSAAARARVVTQFDVSRWIQQHDEIFEAMIHKK